MIRTDWLSRWALYEPDAPALRDADGGETLTFAELDRQGQGLAAALTEEIGLEAGDRIAILSENTLTHLVLFVAAQKAGWILVPLNFRLAPAELDYLLQDAEPKLMVTHADFATTRGALKRSEQIPHHLSIQALDELRHKTPLHPFQARELEEDQPIFILYTSGTTGFPKGAIYTHRMLFWNSVNTSISLRIGTGSSTVNSMPFFHTGGWNVLVTPFLHLGGYTCLLRKFDPGRVLELLEREQATIFMGVPTMLQMIAEDPGFAEANLSSLDYLIVGGEPMPIPLIERWHEKGIAVRQGYGMTEVGPNLTSLHQRDAIRKKGSIGRPNFYVQTRIVDDAGQTCGAGQPGELLLRGPMVTPGYWRNPEATEKALRAGWFHTGDRVMEDEEGYLFVVDRIKNMFISGGENVYPAEVERVLLQHPDILEAVVVGTPDDTWGEVGRAFLVVRKGTTPAAEELQSFCRERLAKFKVPKHIVFLEALPKNATGKLDRKRLQEDH